MGRLVHCQSERKVSRKMGQNVNRKTSLPDGAVAKKTLNMNGGRHRW